MREYLDESEQFKDGPCESCGCLRSVHWIGIDGEDTRNCPNAKTCNCQRPSDKPTEFIFKQ